MNTVFKLYRDAFGGLSQPAWMLALIMFINRSGAMVLPFLSIYLTESLQFDIEQAGIIMSLFGLGAMAGSFLGGWLTDRFGHFYVQFLSLIVGGFGFLLLQFLSDFASLGMAIFLLSTITESLRPANAASVAHYAIPANLTRAFSLNRMAINLGFSIGPALGGLLAAISFKLIFIADGITCIIAGMVFFFYFHNRKTNPKQIKKNAAEAISKSPYQDIQFLMFVVLNCMFAIIFMQFFTTLPLYYRQIYGLPEFQIGALLALNGVIIFMIEMVLVYKIGDRFKISTMIMLGTFLSGIAYVVLNLFSGIFLLIFSMILITLGEIFAMPFMVTYTTRLAAPDRRGAYMGVYGFGFALAFILAPYFGTRIVENWGFETLWWAAGGLSMLTSIGYYFVLKRPHAVNP